jgi:hypothetical protein
VDKRTGETLYRNDDLPDTPVTRFRIRGDREPTPHVTVETNAGTIRLTMTDRPRPPRPPANDIVEAARETETAPRGLIGVGQRVGEALRGTIEKKAETPQEVDDDD